MNAYDYDKQEWVEGRASRALLRQQLLEERELLAGPRGGEYLRQTGRPENQQQALAMLDAKLESLFHRMHA